jgi:hypothetical protein
MKHLNFLMLLLFFALSAFTQTTIIPFGSSYKYLDNGSNQGTTWKNTSFSDATWKTGAAQLGYGDGDEATVVSYGTNAKKKYLTTYFRKVVAINNPASYANFTLGLKRDDGAVVYLNGTEIFRSNMPTGTISYTTKASSAAADDGNTVQPVNIASSAFINGNNTLAIEVHQFNSTDPDLSFDLNLVANAPAANIPPVANAGTDQTITLPTNSVSLNGTGSSDADGTISTYIWSQVSGPSAATIATPSSVTTNSSNLVQGSYVFRLTVTDNNGASSFDDVAVTVNPAANIAPVANAGNDQTITLPVNSVSLSGAGSSDADGTITSYAWSQVSGPSAATIGTPSSVTTTVSGLLQGTYVFRLTVTDNNSAASNDDITIIVNPANVAPVANAGNDQTITLPTSSVSLSGTASSDADGTITTYGWSQASGPSTATIVNASSVSTTVSNLVQGTYVFRLAVTDNNGASSTDDVSVTVNPATVISTYNVIDYGGVWKYLDNGTDQGTAWRGSGFSDATWASGPGQLGYGDGDEATVVSYGPNSSAKYTTTYFRKQVSVSSPSSYTNFSLGVKRDDGIVLYVNGVEVYRNNMPAGTITFATLASTAASDDGGTIQVATIASSFFVDGVNTVAAEIHQNAGTSTDISFDLELRANAPGFPVITRGPYLQMGNGTGVSLRWRTDVATDSKISVGTSFGSYTQSATNATVSTEHEVRISGLSPDSKYYYSFGSTTQTLQATTANYFNTAPGANTTRKIKIAAFGDCGRNDNGFQAGTLSSYQNYVGSSPAEIMLLLGDNAYDAGTDAEYTSRFFNAYSSNILKNHVVFPSPGNHDYANTSARQTDHNVPYYSIFTMPTAAECGGVASGTEAFYSYNWGNIHFLSLDSYGFESGSTRLYDTLGPQATWVKNDLAANSSKWTIAYWHHPPYTMGSHNSDTESELINMRQKFIGIMERYGVDMIICGHSHDYERSYLLKGYTGNEASFSVATNAVSGSSAYYDGSSNSCPYNLADGKVNHGTVYVVAGSAGADGVVQAGYPHNALPFSVDDGGMLYFEVENNRLDAKFIRRDGVIADKFTIVKDAGKSSSFSINAGEFVTLTASWVGTYSWSNGSSSRSITVSPNETTSYTCTDGNSCLTDNFTVTVAQPITMYNIKLSSEESREITAYPVPVKRGMTLNITGNNEPVQANIFNEKGQKMLQFKVQNLTLVNTSKLPAGVYYLKCNETSRPVTKKIIVIE